MASNLESDVPQLEREVEEARTRLADTLDRLTSPATTEAMKKELMDYGQGLKNEALEYVQKTKDQLVSSGREKAQGLADDLKQKAMDNPLAVMLIGAGVVWHLYKKPPITTALVGAGIAMLMRSGSGAKRVDDKRSYRDPYREAQPRGYVPGGVAGYGYPVAEEAPGASGTERITTAASSVMEKAREAGERAREAAHGVAARVSEAAERAGTAASEMIDKTTAGAAGVAHDVADRTGDMLDRVQRNPWALGAIGMVAGTAIAQAARRTETGNRLFGEAGHVFGRGARTAQHGVSTTARQAAQAAGGAASSARHMASGAAEAVSSSVKGVASGVRSATDRMAHAAEDAAASATSAAAEMTSWTHRGPSEEASRRRGQPRRRRSTRRAIPIQQEVLELGRRYPLLLGTIGLALGAAAGGLLQPSEAEDNWFGGASDKVKQQAKEMAQEQYGSLVDAAGEIYDQVLGSGEAAPQEAGSPATEVVIERPNERAAMEAQRQGLGPV